MSQIIGLKSGVFAITTKGHIEALKYCRERCDYLIVVINDDNYLRNKKGTIIQYAETRSHILRAIRYVDEVHVYSGPNETEWIRKFKNEQLYRRFGAKAHLRLFHAKYTLEKKHPWPGENIVDSIVVVPDFVSESTTDIIKRIKNE